MGRDPHIPLFLASSADNHNPLLMNGLLHFLSRQALRWWL